MKQSYKLLILLVVLSLAVFALAGCGGGDDESKPTIEFGGPPWSSTPPPSYVAMTIIEEELGYPTEFVEADVGLVYADLAQGGLDALVDAWLPTLHANYLEEFEGDIEDLGAIYTGANSGWVVPAYVEADSIADLPQYNEEFDANGDGTGDVVGIEPGSGIMQASETVIETYGLDYDLLDSSEGAMIASLRDAIDNEDWIIITGWRPHWKFIEYDLKYLEDPEGVFQPDEVHAVVSSGLKDKAEDVYTFLQNFEMPIEDVEQMILKISQEDADPKELAQQWVEENQDKVDAMLQ